MNSLLDGLESIAAVFLAGIILAAAVWAFSAIAAAVKRRRH